MSELSEIIEKLNACLQDDIDVETGRLQTFLIAENAEKAIDAIANFLNYRATTIFADKERLDALRSSAEYLKNVLEVHMEKDFVIEAIKRDEIESSEVWN
jgi:phosphopantetheine adenylyltransferase